MKYTLMGFSQKMMLEFKMDLTDMTILRWLVDFKDSSKMDKEIINNDMYYWVSYKKLKEDIPMIGISSNDVLRRRLKKMCENGILKHITKKENGTWSFYTLGENYKYLISDEYKKEEKKEEEKKEEEKKEEEKKKFEEDSKEIEISKFLYNEILKKNKNFKKPNFQSWAKKADLMLRIDKRNFEETKKIIKFALDNNFWCGIIKNTEKLREHYDTLYMQKKNRWKQNKPVQATNYEQRDYSDKDDSYWNQFYSNLNINPEAKKI